MEKGCLPKFCPEWGSGKWVSQAKSTEDAGGAMQFPDKKSDLFFS